MRELRRGHRGRRRDREEHEDGDQGLAQHRYAGCPGPGAPKRAARFRAWIVALLDGVATLGQRRLLLAALQRVEVVHVLVERSGARRRAPCGAPWPGTIVSAASTSGASRASVAR